ncbi:DUF6232 family protein [Dactylosporangium sp. AC04546]|uniref:DUF6232 family protein n=1 Tax=Dactylosporangium sp. AC04546 TaxID=2862460 RepID=UPI001EDE5BB3|nr:DUF6232 family protein [Dactylosporangium sp. AC04546]WVK81368.1 DUF6232 family protein [Dactylosporangium sp. AC04546]
MPLFYRGPRVRITHSSFETGVRYPVADFARVWVVVPREPAVALVEVSCSSGAFAVVAALATHHAVGWVFLLLTAGMMAGFVRRRRRARTARRELWAYIPGHGLVRIFTTADPVEFGQVRRGLQRAIEWNEDTRS